MERKCQLFTATRLAKRDVTNVRLARADACSFFRDRVVDACLQAIHVYFPDPWWKRRHRKRRLFTTEFARECVRVLRPGGLLWLATDVKDYFTIMTRIVGQQPEMQPTMEPPDERLDKPNWSTNFERRHAPKAEVFAVYARLCMTIRMFAPFLSFSACSIFIHYSS